MKRVTPDSWSRRLTTSPFSSIFVIVERDGALHCVKRCHALTTTSLSFSDMAAGPLLRKMKFIITFSYNGPVVT